MIEAEDDACLHRDAVRVDARDGAGVVLDAIEGFRDRVEAGLRDRFEAEEQLLAAAARGEIEEFVIGGGVDAGLGAPPFAMRSERAKQLSSRRECRRRCCRPTG